MSDIRIVWDPPGFRGDWRMVGSVLEIGHDLETAVLVSLFTWAADAPNAATLPGVVDPEGWWADGFTGDPIGSKLWKLLRAPKTEQTRLLAIGYCRDALKWLIDDGVAASVDVQAEWQGGSVTPRLALQVVITAPGSGIPFQFSWAWDTLADIAAPAAITRGLVPVVGDDGTPVVGDDGTPVVG